MQLFARLGIHPEPFKEGSDAPVLHQQNSAFYDAAALN
jgi:hypothetical protein